MVILDCNLTPVEQVINITWKKNGFPLVEQEHLHVLPNGSLFISSQAVVKDSKYPERAGAEGNYSCVSHSSLGTVTSQTAAVRFSSKYSGGFVDFLYFSSWYLYRNLLPQELEIKCPGNKTIVMVYRWDWA